MRTAEVFFVFFGAGQDHPCVEYLTYLECIKGRRQKHVNLT